jgi:hypothetical protein
VIDLIIDFVRQTRSFMRETGKMYHMADTADHGRPVNWVGEVGQTNDLYRTGKKYMSRLTNGGNNAVSRRHETFDEGATNEP